MGNHRVARESGLRSPPPEALWAKARDRSLSEARRILRNEHDAEEAAHEALLRAWRYRDSQRAQSPADWLPWVGAIARNEALRLAVRQRRRSEAELAGASPPRTEPGLDRALDAINFQHLLEPLGESDQMLLRLRYEADLTQAEIAQRLGTPEGTVKVRLHRLRLRLRAEARESP